MSKRRKIKRTSWLILNIKTCKRPKYTLIYQQTNELRGVEKKSGESFSTFSASVPRPAFENIKTDTIKLNRVLNELWYILTVNQYITLFCVFSLIQMDWNNFRISGNNLGTI